MKIILHVGVHKSATTAVQHSLLETYGSSKPAKNCSVWFPTFKKEIGPGHAVLWRDWVGIEKYEGDRPRLQKVITQAVNSNCENLVISAEDISLSSNDILLRLGKDLRDHKLDVYVTMSSVQHRLYSTWQENVKHGWGVTLADSGPWYFGDFQNDSFKKDDSGFNTLTPSCRASGWPTFRGDFLRRLAKHLEPDQLHLIPIPINNPRIDVFQRISQAMGIALPRPANELELRRQTQSLGYHEAEYICRLNAALTSLGRVHETKEYSGRCTNFFKELGPPRVKVKMPDVLEKYFTRYWRLLCEEVKELQGTTGLTIHGELSELNDLKSRV